MLAISGTGRVGNQVIATQLYLTGARNVSDASFIRHAGVGSHANDKVMRTVMDNGPRVSLAAKDQVGAILPSTQIAPTVHRENVTPPRYFCDRLRDVNVRNHPTVFTTM